MIRETVEAILMQAGMPMRLKGFRYIVDAILLLDTPEWAQPKWTALYYKIASMHGVNAAQVERAIRSAFSSARSRFENYEITEKYLGFTNCDNSNSIVHLYQAIRAELCPTPAAPQSAAPGVDEEQLRRLIRQTLLELLAGTATTAAQQMDKSIM